MTGSDELDGAVAALRAAGARLVFLHGSRGHGPAGRTPTSTCVAYTRCHHQVSLVHMVIRNVAEAKTTLSQLLDRALAGEEVIVARAGTPLVRLVPIEAPASRELGFLPLDVPDAAFDPLEDDDLVGWR